MHAHLVWKGEVVSVSVPLLLIHDPVPLGLARRPPSQHGQTSPPRVSCTWPRQPSRVGPARCCLLSSMRVPSTHRKPLAGCLGAQSAAMPPTSGLPDRRNTSSTAGRSSSIRFRLHLFQPHQADQMFDPQTGSSYASKQ